MAAPAIKINGGSPGAKAAIAANTSFSATLDSTAGVRTVEWDILSTDETSAADDYTLVTSGTVGQTVTLTSLGEGTAAILHVKVNGGYSTQTGLRDPTGTEATAKFYVALPSGLEVGAANEKLESDPTTGATSLLNAGIRLADTLDVGQYDAQYLVRTASSVLTDETAIDAITSTVTFQSTSTTPLGAKRTDSATTATVDVAEVTALSSGTAAAGFGPTVKFIGEVTGGGAENYGRVGFVAEDLTAGSEDTAFVAQARTAGGALADVLKVSGTKITFPALAGGGSGNLAVNNDGEVSMGAGGSYVATSTTITATSPIRIDGASSADLSTGRTLSFSVGADVPWGGNGITGIASLDNSGGAMTIGANTTEQTIGKSGTTAAFAGAATVASTLGVSDAVSVNIAGIATTSTVGFTLAESTASSAGTTVRRSPFMTWTGHAWVSGADKTMRVTAEVRPRTSTNVDIYFQYDTGSGTLSDLFFVSTSTSAGFWQALSCFTFEVSSGGNGYRFAGGSQGGLAMDGSGHIQVKSGGTQRVELISSIGAATNADGLRLWNDTTRSAGNIVGFGTGASYTSKAAVAYDGTWNGPVLRNTAGKTGTYTASLYELVEYSPAGGTFTVTLPSPVAGATGQLLVTKNIGSSGIPLSVTTPSGNIDNAATVAIAGGYASDTMVSDGANGWLRISALRPWNFTAIKTTDYTTAIGEVVKCDPSGAGFNVDLPAVPTTNTMREIDIIVKNVTSSTNTITIRPNGSDTIDGAANTTITTARGVVRLLALPGGTDWLIV